MSNHIKFDQLSKELHKYLTEYNEDINEEVRSTATNIAREALGEVKAKSPVSKKDVWLRGHEKHAAGSYQKGWTISTQTSHDKYVKKIWNKTDYRLTHLLEFGHATRNGGRTTPIPHIRGTEKKYLEKFEKQLEQEIKK